jgi:hypothetical protein
MLQTKTSPALHALYASLLVLALHACGTDSSTPSATDEGDASGDALFSGGTSVIPSSAPDGGSASLDGYGYVPGYASADGTAPCPRDAATEEADADALEGSVDGPLTVTEEGGDAAACPGSLAAGDLIIDELMIASQAGVGDHGEWVEVASTRDCALDLNGLFAEVPHGKGTTLASVTTDVWLPPHGFFLIADSADPTENHNLPGTIFTWGSGTSSDVLKNSGDTLTLYTATVTIDMLTYPASAKLVDGASMAFPSDCDPSLRAEFGNWQPSLASWTPGFFGTPAAPNTDVTCAVQPPPPPPTTSPTPCGA